MTVRTASLLFLFVAALIVAGALLGFALRFAVDFGLPEFWVGAAVAVLSVSGTLFLGRRYVLPKSLTGARTAFVTVTVLTVTTLIVAVVVSWVLTMAVGSRIPLVSRRSIFWFVALWLAVDALHRTRGKERMPLP